MKLKWTNHRVLSSTCTENTDANLYVPFVTWSGKGNQKLTKPFRKEFERSVYWNKNETKSESKNVKNEYKYFPESNFIGFDGLFFGLNHDNDVKRYKARRYYLPYVSLRIMRPSSSEETSTTKTLILI